MPLKTLIPKFTFLSFIPATTLDLKDEEGKHWLEHDCPVAAIRFETQNPGNVVGINYGIYQSVPILQSANLSPGTPDDRQPGDYSVSLLPGAITKAQECSYLLPPPGSQMIQQFLDWVENTKPTTLQEAIAFFETNPTGWLITAEFDDLQSPMHAAYRDGEFAWFKLPLSPA